MTKGWSRMIGMFLAGELDVDEQIELLVGNIKGVGPTYDTARKNLRAKLRAACQPNAPIPSVPPENPDTESLLSAFAAEVMANTQAQRNRPQGTLHCDRNGHDGNPCKACRSSWEQLSDARNALYAALSQRPVTAEALADALEAKGWGKNGEVGRSFRDDLAAALRDVGGAP